MNSTRKKALFGALVSNIIFGFSILFSTILLNMTLPSVMVATRFVVAFIVLNLLIIIGGKIKKSDGQPLVTFSLKGKPKKDLFLMAMFQPVVYFFGESYGITFTSSAFAGTIIAVIPLMAVVWDVVFMKEKVGKKQVLCAAGSVVGVIITTLGAGEMKSSFWGVLILLVAVFAGSIYFMFSKKASAYYNAFERTFAMFGVASLVFGVTAAVQCAGEYERWILEPMKTPVFWWSIFYLAVMSSVVAFVIQNISNVYITVSEAAIFTNMITVISIISGVVILKETFTLWQVVGAAIIIVSVYISSISGE